MKRRVERQPLKRSPHRLLLTGGGSAVILLGLFTVGSGIGAQAPGPCDPPNGNPVVCENQLAGDPASEWDLTGASAGAGDPTIQGFATAISVNRGQAVSFKIDTDSLNYRLDIYRMGYYDGLGARQVAVVAPSAFLPQLQPACLSDPATGLLDCGNWMESASWTVPATATSGIYFAKAIRTDTGGASHIVFIVRDDASQADLLFQTSDTTWQAYNQYGGNSLYVGAPGTNPGRAYKVSYNRPFTTRGTAPEDWVFNAEYPMVRFLESNGYNVAYATGVDTDRLGAAAIQQHRVFLSVGHDEYWSGAQRANVEAARNAGVNLAFFSGNEVFWKTRWENSISAPAAPYRTLVSYKETHANAKIDANPAWTGTWRDPRFSPPSDGGRPENELTGTIFAVNTGTAGIKVPEADGDMRFWRNTSIASLATGTVATLPLGTLGYEWDEDRDNGFRPPGLVRLSDTTVAGVDYLRDYGSTYSSGTANHALTLYRHASGARVFGAGTVQWSWGLDGNHDRGAAAPSLSMRQATVNLMADMGVQPLTIQAGLTTALPSTDIQAPSSAITSPAANSTVPANATVTITGTAVDHGGGRVGGVEVSVDGGASWHPAAGRAAWTYAWPTGSGRTVTLMSRAADDSGNIELPLTSRTITVGGGTGTCPCTIWSNAQLPGELAEPDGNAVEVGTKFRADISGFITGIQFYKGPQNVGPHVGHLWTAGGSLLATVTFTNETTSGWQQASLSGPVAITANTTYVVSYHSSSGFYSADANYFTNSGVDNSPLHALQDGVDGRNGVYRYGSSAFPSDSFQGANYWVDVVFATTVAPDATPPVVSVFTPANGASTVSITTSVTAIFSEAMNPASITSSTFELRNSANVKVPAVVSYGELTATLQPSSPLKVSAAYTARVIGGSTGVKDSAGNALAADFVWSFATEAQPATGGPGGPILLISSQAKPFSQYYAEVLRAEGLNSFGVSDIADMSASTLAGYDVVILGDIDLSAAQVTLLTNWVSLGGNLIAMRPDKKLAPLLGLTDAGTTLADGYMRVNTSLAPGTGIVGETMQFHGVADRYSVSGASTVATLYSSASLVTTSPAVTLRTVGTAGGQAAAFTYDLAKSVVLTRQGNPGWSGQDRDGLSPVRSDDLFFGGAQPDYVDRSKIAIPQADEQQRLLANLIALMNLDRKPLPKFWYFPRGAKAVVVMTGDDHATNGTEGRFAIYNTLSPSGCSVTDWECVRGTSYIYPGTPISLAVAESYVAQGYEIAVHVTTNCGNYTPSSLEGNYASDIANFTDNFPGLPAPKTNRTHCIPWSDYDTQPQVARAHGIRLDTNYYYWPGSWVDDVPGLFTGSGMPMRFAKADGTMIDVYQAVTQMTDESGQSYPYTVDTLLDRALGAEGYYGAFVANMHTDFGYEPGASGSSAIVSSAQLRGVPIVSAEQMLTWLDGRNGSSFAGIAWNGTNLSFAVVAGAGSNGLQTLLPATFNGHALTALTKNGTSVSFEAKTIKGVAYAAFDSQVGDYVASYATDTTAPLITSLSAIPSSASAVISWSTDEAATSLVEYGVSATTLLGTATVSGMTLSHTVSLTGLNPGTTYFYRVTSADVAGNPSTSPATSAAAASFRTTVTDGLRGDVAVDFGSGQGLWLSTNTSGSAPQWSHIHGQNPSHMAAGDLDGNGQTDLVVNFPGYGVWIWSNNSTWALLNPSEVSDIVVGDLDGNGQKDVILSFMGHGIYAWMNNSTWVIIHSLPGSGMAAGNLDNDSGHRDELIVNFPAAGVWIWTNNTAWVQLHTQNATHIGTGDVDGNGKADVVLDFNGYGVWTWMNNAAWVQRHTVNSGGITVANIDGDGGGRADLVVDFPGYGVWVLFNGTTWLQINVSQTTAMAAADLDYNGQADLIASVPGTGILILMNNSTWSQLHALPAEEFAAGRVDN